MAQSINDIDQLGLFPTDQHRDQKPKAEFYSWVGLDAMHNVFRLNYRLKGNSNVQHHLVVDPNCVVVTCLYITPSLQRTLLTVHIRAE